MNACVYALVFIRAIVIAKEKVEKNKVEQICKLFRVTSEMVFSDEILEYAGDIIGNVEILVVIAEHWKKGISLSTLLKKVAQTTPSPSPQPTSTILLELGLDKAKVAKLIRDVDIILKTEIEREVNPSTVFTRKYSKRHLVHHFDRSMILYDGDYIEAPKNFENGSTSKKQRKF
uniref:Uncharacterized protein n=1 Tax=Panagrolaimus superbus TaxID=310955 RepID=A0A914Y250_9BILA